MSREWKPGDWALTDRVVGGVFVESDRVRLIARAEEHPRYWLVAIEGSEQDTIKLFEDEFRPEPWSALFGAVPVGAILDQLAERQAKYGPGRGFPLNVPPLPVGDPAQKHESRPGTTVQEWAFKTVTKLLRAGRLDDVTKNLPLLLASFGFNQEERDALIAQIKNGEQATRDTAPFADTARGVLEWQAENPQERRADVRVTGHVLEVHVTVGKLGTRKVKFLAPVPAARAALAIKIAVATETDALVEECVTTYTGHSGAAWEATPSNDDLLLIDGD